MRLASQAIGSRRAGPRGGRGGESTLLAVRKTLVACFLAFGIALDAAPAGAAPELVRLKDSLLARPAVRIPVGGIVTWRNDGHLLHTVTSDDGVFDSGAVARGQTLMLQFPAAGVYRYFCTYHGAPGGRGMSGIIQVGDEPAPETPPPPEAREGGPRTLRVPEELPSIQGAVDAARPNDLVLVSPGTYEEAVVISTPNLVVRGLDRAGVVLEGSGTRANGVLVVAGGVAIENLTARGYASSGFIWWRVDGYRGSHLSALGNGDHGVYVMGSRRGRIDHVYAAGNRGSGIHVAGCGPCDASVTDSAAAGNGVGISAANAGGNLLVARSEAAHNLAGIALVTLDSEPGPPQRGAAVIGNWVHDNAGRRVPPKQVQFPWQGTGILAAGAEENRIERNLVENNASYGILAGPSIDRSLWTPSGNRVVDNLVRGSGRADLALGAPAGGGNCFAGNRHGTSLPPAAERYHPCGSLLARLGGGDPGVTADRLHLLARSVARGFDPEPPPAVPESAPAGMPDPAGSPAEPATGELPQTPLDTIPTPQPGPPVPNPEKEVVVLGLNLPSPPLAVLLGLYAYVLPIALYATWMGLGLWDVARRGDLGGGGRIAWGAFVLAVPLVGPLVYLLAARSPIPWSFRLFLVLGGAGLYALLAAASFFSGTL